MATLPCPSMKTESQNDSAEMNLRSLRPTPSFYRCGICRGGPGSRKDLKAHNETGIAGYQLRFLSFVPNYQSNTCSVLSLGFFGLFFFNPYNLSIFLPEHGLELLFIYLFLWSCFVGDILSWHRFFLDGSE